MFGLMRGPWQTNPLQARRRVLLLPLLLLRLRPPSHVPRPPPLLDLRPLRRDDRSLLQLLLSVLLMMIAWQLRLQSLHRAQDWYLLFGVAFHVFISCV